MKLFTIGYQAASVESFIASLRAQQIAHLIDIREVALSRKKGFSKTALSERAEGMGLSRRAARGAQIAARAGDESVRIFRFRTQPDVRTAGAGRK